MSLPIKPEIDSDSNYIEMDVLSLMGGNSRNQINYHPENEDDIFGTSDLELIPDTDSTRVTGASMANFRRDLMGYVSPVVTQEQELAFQEQIAQMGGVDTSKESTAKLKIELLNTFQKKIDGSKGTSKQEIIQNIIKLLEEQIKIIKQNKDLNFNSKDELSAGCRKIAKEHIKFIDGLKDVVPKTNEDYLIDTQQALSEMETIDETFYGIEKLKPIEEIQAEQSARIKAAKARILNQAENN